MIKECKVINTNSVNTIVDFDGVIVQLVTPSNVGETLKIDNANGTYRVVDEDSESFSDESADADESKIDDTDKTEVKDEVEEGFKKFFNLSK